MYRKINKVPILERAERSETRGRFQVCAECTVYRILFFLVLLAITFRKYVSKDFFCRLHL